MCTSHTGRGSNPVAFAYHVLHTSIRQILQSCQFRVFSSRFTLYSKLKAVFKADKDRGDNRPYGLTLTV